jgi:hypothetical protein
MKAIAHAKARRLSTGKDISRTVSADHPIGHAFGKGRMQTSRRGVCLAKFLKLVRGRIALPHGENAGGPQAAGILRADLADYQVWLSSDMRLNGAA